MSEAAPARHRIAFVGLGNMGSPMAANLLRAGYMLTVFDLNPTAVHALEGQGAKPAPSAEEAIDGAEIIVTMLPAGEQVREIYLREGGIVARAAPGALLLDCSTIDVESARAVHAAADTADKDLLCADAPVSGGVGGAEAGTLTFMVGANEAAFQASEPLLQAMGRTIVHCGGAGNGQAAKICNNMMLGIQMMAVCEAFGLARQLGLPDDKLFEVSSKASGQCWSLTTYCPAPGLVPSSPANRDYRPGFTAAMMTKDLRLAQQASHNCNAITPLGAQAYQFYTMFVAEGHGTLDFSAIFNKIVNKSS